MDLLFGMILLFGLLLTAIFILFVKSSKIIKITATILLALYIVILAIGVFSDISIGKSISVVFDFSGKWVSKDIIWSPIPESSWGVLTNITMLIPLGLYIGTICKKPLIKATIIGFGTGFLIELLQFILPIPRFPQVSDIWLNGVSTILGCLYAMLFVWLKTKIIANQTNNNTATKEEQSPKAKTNTNTQTILANTPKEEDTTKHKAQQKAQEKPQKSIITKESSTSRSDK